MINEILFIFVITLANLIQGTAGFGGAPLAMSASIPLIGVDSAKAVVTLLFWIAPLITTIRNIHKVNWKIYGIMVLFMAIGVTVGLLIFEIVPKTPLMIAYGAIVVLIGIVKLFNKKDRALKKPWNYIALLFAGLMQGLFTSGGPFLVLYASGALKGKEEFRATCSAIWTTLNTYLCIMMLINGKYTSYEGLLTLAALVPVLAATLLGSRIAKKLKGDSFMKFVYILLVISGAILIMNAIIG